MSRHNIADELDAVIRNRRKYAAFFEWPDKAVKECDVVCELLSSMHAFRNNSWRLHDHRALARVGESLL